MSTMQHVQRLLASNSLNICPPKTIAELQSTINLNIYIRIYIMSSDEDEILSTALFQEPNDYFQPEKPCTYADYTLRSGQTLHLRLVGQNPLWVPAYELTLSKLLHLKVTNSAM